MRRDRHSASWTGGALPQSDGTPKFVVRLHDAGGAEIERYTVNNATQLSITAAMQNADLSGLQNNLRVSVQQISSTTVAAMGEGQISPIYDCAA